MTDQVVPRLISRRAFLVGVGGVGISAILVACGAPATTAPTQAPAATSAPAATATTAAAAGPTATTGAPLKDMPPKKEVARKDTLYYAAGGDAIPNPQNFNVYTVGQLGRVRDILNRTVYEF